MTGVSVFLGIYSQIYIWHSFIINKMVKSGKETKVKCL